jgi:SAM-dependent methyltransferase
MSVGRLAGGSTEAARGSGAQRGRAKRAAAERTVTERTKAERSMADGATAERTTAEAATAEPTAAEPTAAGAAAAGPTAVESTAVGPATAEPATAGPATAEPATTGSATTKPATTKPATTKPATTKRITTGGAAAQGAAAVAAGGRGPVADASARRNADPASNVVVVSSHTGPAAAATSATPVADSRPTAAPDTGLFARYIRDYIAGRDGQQVMILEAGCTTAGDDLGLAGLRETGADIVVSLIDDDQPVTSAALSADGSLADCVQGDLRTVPLPPRSQDIVLCALLLQRIQNAELVLDRLVAAIRPGGLLLLHFGDRDSAAGFLDRVLPLAARRAVWRRRRPSQPGPYPAVYERLSSARGVQAYALMRELVIAERRARGGLAGTLTGPPGFLAAQKLIAWLSRGRLTAAHEELLYVLRKPEDRFARIL